MSRDDFTCQILKDCQSNFDLLSSKIYARLTKISTPHGAISTPVFMPVGTRAFVNHLTPAELLVTQSQIILGGNTYHMLCSPGMEVIQAAGGMHKFMGWRKAILSDSGGFQVFSLAKNRKICTIDAGGAHFKHPVSGQLIHLTPETSLQAQKTIGADIIMAFDECTPEEGGRDTAIAALDRTHRWLEESKAVHEKSPNSIYGLKQALFGIIQGGSFRDLREQSARFIVALDLDGIALGGEIIGLDIAKTCEIIDWVRPLLPKDKIRYAMGVGANPQDLIDVAAHGFDLFDCVAPTRNARHGSLYCGTFVEKNGWLEFASEEEKGRILIKKKIYVQDEKPIMADCGCYTCQNFSRAYLHHLFKSHSILYSNLACMHNIYVMQETCEQMRKLILKRSG